MPSIPCCSRGNPRPPLSEPPCWICDRDIPIVINGLRSSWWARRKTVLFIRTPYIFSWGKFPYSMKAKKGWSEIRASPKTTPPREALVKHFSEASWTDFARNLVSKAERMAMQKHLDDGCEKCSATLRTDR